MQPCHRHPEKNPRNPRKAQTQTLSLEGYSEPVPMNSLDIFNQSLAGAVVPSYLKSAIIVPAYTITDPSPSLLLSTEDAKDLLHSSLQHLEHRGTHVLMLFSDYSSVFEMIFPDILIRRLHHLGLSSHICSWIMGFLTSCPSLSGWSPTSPPLSHSAQAPHRAVC